MNITGALSVQEHPAAAVRDASGRAFGGRDPGPTSPQHHPVVAPPICLLLCPRVVHCSPAFFIPCIIHLVYILLFPVLRICVKIKIILSNIFAAPRGDTRPDLARHLHTLWFI